MPGRVNIGKKRRLLRARIWVTAVGAMILAVSPVAPPMAAGTTSSTTAATSLAADTEDATLQADAANYYSIHYGVALSVAYERLQIQDDAQSVLNQVISAIGNEWAGSWFDPTDQGRFKVAVVSAQPRPTGANIDNAKAILAAKGVDAYTDFVRVNSSWNDLTTAQKSINQQLSDLITAGKATTEIDPETNSVVIKTVKDLTSPESSSINAAAAPVSISVEPTDETSFVRRFQSCALPGGPGSTTELFCDPPPRGGVLISSGVSYCTAGFVVASLSYYKPYIMTAGHCLYFAPGATWSTRFSDTTVHQIGAAHSYTFPGSGDYGIITIDNPPGWDLTANAYVWVGQSYEGTTTQNSFYSIYQAGTSSMNMTVCTTSGVLLPTTSYHTDCGTVTGLDKPFTGEENGHTYTVYGEAESSLCGTDGSSGGPVYKNHTGYGLISGGSGCDEDYQGLVGAEQGSNVGSI